MRRALLTAVLLAPSLALAQVTISESGDKPDRIINIAECQGASGADSRWAFQWSIASTTFSEVEVKVSDKSGCPTTADDTTAKTDSLGTFPNTTNTTSTFGASDILSRLGIPSSACETGANVTVNVCVFPRNTAGTLGSTITGSFLFDRAKPGTPNPPTVVPGDGALRVSWPAAPGSGLSYRVEVVPRDTPGAEPFRSEDVTALSVRMSNLEIGREYEVRLIVISQGGNLSAPSEPALGVPAAVNDFWETYRNAGGAEEGGCSTTGGGTLALLAFVPFALRRRRS